MTIVISGFPGVGKTWLLNNPPKDMPFVKDSDSSQFSWSAPGVRNPEFPANYMKHIQEHLGVVDILLVSSHKVVRNALLEAKIPFILVYPLRTLKQEYLERFRNRGNAGGFVNLLDLNWDEWIGEMEACSGPKVPCVMLKSGEYLADVIGDIQAFVGR